VRSLAGTLGGGLAEYSLMFSSMLSEDFNMPIDKREDIGGTHTHAISPGSLIHEPLVSENENPGLCFFVSNK
jgi:hypothetical protein